MRITTNALLRNYKSNLNTTINNLNISRTHVMTHRSFNSAAENPAGAARASQLHRKYFKNQDHISMVKDLQARQDCQEDALYQVSKSLTIIKEEYNVEAMTGTNGPDERKTFATAIRQMQKSMVLSLNSSYEDSFVFAGTDGKNPPFELSDDGKLTYRGYDVDCENLSLDKTNLDKLANESLYVDLGFGLKLDHDGLANPSSAFDMALPGIKAIGYGKDADGMSNNAIVLAGQLADELEKDDFSLENYEKLMTKFRGSTDEVLDNLTQLGVKTEFLTNTKSRLENADISLQEQMESVEGIDMAQAITDYMWNQYAYNAALKVGTSILSPSFIDFMK